MRKGKIISILMESPLYVMLSEEERRSLIAELTKIYPSFFKVKERPKGNCGADHSLPAGRGKS